MDRICVATSDGRAYYLISSRLRKAGMVFVSALPDQIAHDSCDVVITTNAEMWLFGENALPVEDLDEDPTVMKGQILARASDGEGDLLLGVDPGSRIGLAVFYGGKELASQTFNSRGALCRAVFELVNKIPNSQSTIKIGNGEPRMSAWLATRIRENLRGSLVEVVDEAGTSSRSARYRGLPKDQRAAARIAFRKGKPRGR